MFFDADGRPAFNGKVVKTLEWDVFTDSALPSWLTALGTSPIATFTSPATSNGRCRMTTKSSTPAINDVAGIVTAFNIDASQFSEIGFYIFSVISDGADNASYLSLNYHNGTNAGADLYSTAGGAGATRLKVNSTAENPPWQIANGAIKSQRKDLGLTIRPADKEVFATAGDPYDGAGVVWHNKGVVTMPTARPFEMKITVANTAAQRYFEFAKVRLRLVSN